MPRVDDRRASSARPAERGAVRPALREGQRAGAVRQQGPRAIMTAQGELQQITDKWLGARRASRPRSDAAAGAATTRAWSRCVDTRAADVDPVRRRGRRDGVAAPSRQHVVVFVGPRHLVVTSAPGWPRGQGDVLRRRRRSRRRFLTCCAAFCSTSRSSGRRAAASWSSALVIALVRGARTARCSSRCGSWPRSTPTCSAASRRCCWCSCSASACPALQLPGSRPTPVVWGHVALILLLQRLRRRGVPGRHRVGAPQPGGGRPLARPVSRLQTMRLRGAAAGGAARRPAAAERLHLAAEGHRAGRPCSGRSRRCEPPRSYARRLQLHAATSWRRCCSSRSPSRWPGSPTGCSRASAAGRQAGQRDDASRCSRVEDVRKAFGDERGAARRRPRRGRPTRWCA